MRRAAPPRWHVGGAVFGTALLYFGLLAAYGLNVGEEGGALYLIYRTLTGQRPYIDFFSGYAPAYFYWHALILHFSDFNLLGIRFCLALVNSLTVWLLYTIARSVVPIRFAVLPAIAYLTLLPVVPAVSCSFNVPYPSWYVTLLWLIGLHALRRWAAGRGAAWLLLAGLLAGSSCSFKPNTGLFNLAADALCVVLMCRAATDRRDRVASLLAWLVGGGVVGGVMFIFRAHLWQRDGAIFVAPILVLVTAAARRRASAAHAPETAQPPGDFGRAISVLLAGFGIVTLPWLMYYWWQLGWAGFAHNVLLINAGYEQFFYLPYRALAGRDVAMAAAVVGLTGWASAYRRRSLPLRQAAWLLAVPAAAAAAWVLVAAPMPEGFQRAVLLRVQDASFGAVLLIHWCVIALLVRRGFPRMRGARARDLVCVLIGALFMFLSVYPRSDFFHLSCSLPLTLVLGAVLLHWLTRLWRRAVAQDGAPWVERLTLASAGLGLMVLAAPQLALCRQVAAHYLERTAGGLTRLQLRRAPVLVRNDAAGQAARDLEPVVAYLERERRPGDRLFTFPNLDLICFLAGMHTPARIGYFNPGLPDHIGEADVVDVLAMQPPRFAVVSNPAPLFFADAPAYYFIIRDFMDSSYAVSGRVGSYVVLVHTGGQAGPFPEPAIAERRATPSRGSCAGLQTPIDRQRLRMCLTHADRPTVAALIQLIRDSESTEAAALLAEVWAQRALGAPSESVALLAVRVIGEVGDARAAAALLAAPEARGDGERDMVSTALFNIALRGMIAPFQLGQGGVPATPVVDWSPYEARLRAWARTSSEDTRRRFFAIWVLGQETSEDTAAAAWRTLPADANPGLRLAAAVALSQQGTAADTDERLLDLLPTSPSIVPSLMLRWSRNHPEAAVPQLNRALAHGDPAQREIVAFVAGVLRWPVLVPSLRSAAAAPQARVRLAAVWALGRIEGAEAAGAVRAALSDTDREVQRAAAVAAQQMEHRQ